jgi:hypothetical protein|tara:strand:- start:168 stop:461 length:294 start_codon:yes stop_codon:yes gene_type:complete
MEHLPQIDVPSTEGEYINMANQLKETYDLISEKLFKNEMKLLDLKKDLCCAYGIIRLLDSLTDQMQLPHQFLTLVECLRGTLSDSMDTHVFDLDMAN